jgi:hypothetical protein
VAGGGALIGTGAFTTVEAERTVNVSTAGDASAFLTLQPADGSNGAYANQGGDNDDTVQINLNADADAEDDAAGLNEDAKTTIANIVTVTNNGTQAVRPLSLSITDSDGTAFTDVFSFTSNGDTSTKYDNGDDILSDDLGTGESVNFGIVVNLLNSDGLPGSGDYTLTITAETPDDG